MEFFAQGDKEREEFKIKPIVSRASCDLYHSIDPQNPQYKYPSVAKRKIMTRKSTNTCWCKVLPHINNMKSKTKQDIDKKEANKKKE